MRPKVEGAPEMWRIIVYNTGYLNYPFESHVTYLSVRHLGTTLLNSGIVILSICG